MPAERPFHISGIKDRNQEPDILNQLLALQADFTGYVRIFANPYFPVEAERDLQEDIVAIFEQKLLVVERIYETLGEMGVENPYEVTITNQDTSVQHDIDLLHLANDIRQAVNAVHPRHKFNPETDGSGFTSRRDKAHHYLNHALIRLNHVFGPYVEPEEVSAK